MGTTVVLITHRPGILGITDKILVLVAGNVRAFGPRDEILNALNNKTKPAPAAVSGIPGAEAAS